MLALNKDLDVDYYYGNQTNSNQSSTSDYKWSVMKNEKLDSKFAAKIKSGNLVTNYKIDTVLKDIDNLGLNTLNIPVVIAINDLSSSDMSIDKNSEEQAINLIKKLQGKNINIILEPYPWIANGSKVETEWNPKDINAFFNNWKTKVLKPLIDDIAVPYHVEAFNIGTSFNKIEDYEDQFCEMIDFVKGQYKGLVAYRTSWWVTTNWNDPATKKIEENLKSAYNKKLNNKLFSKLDFISIASYFELTEKDTNTVDNLVGALQSTQRYNRKQNVKQEIKNFNTKWNKPIFFGELGFPPKDKASIEPWNPYQTYKWNDKEQANCFEAYKTVFENEPWNLGFSIFAIGSKESDNNYYPSDDTMEVIKGWYSK
ncbi:glycoside hydrolase family 113 [Clostridium yunnanense]|uniref:glycoside hydrolase family 113 n=1 Tax=Clostridium yunnanense TaxID=2800325 RepID=UPI003B845BD2